MKNSTWMPLVGILSLAAGIFALLNPLAATLTAERLTGYMFIAIGVLMLLSFFADESWGSRILSLILGFAIFAVGVNLLSNPLVGILRLTVVVAILMILIGVLRIIFAFRMPTTGLKLTLFLAGVVSLGLGTMILTSFPFSAAVVLGILLAIELISNGISLIILGRAAGERAS